ncbi:POT family-domain-containing protein [Protomyces lactucae-debilis]|uniref:POT family-domain-containing protein n=1 Tax=Protomyces lactucae-debilis TaxID=2754530 RepID=A0A1Y2FAF2_PROLT|nr:POT family-domain-containing protein [Protomyces lactucae-debilis]ORY80871.1 POT family-domain-containing protein [Protomyces lactucae-debilis]
MAAHMADQVDYAAGHEQIVPYQETDTAEEKKHLGLSTTNHSDRVVAYEAEDDDNYRHPDHPTDEELQTLRKVAGHIPWQAYSVGFVELCERFSYYGVTAIFTNFLQQPLPMGSRTGAGGTDGQSGALGLGQQTATALNLFNSFWAYVMPIAGAVVADGYLGRYKTIMYSIAIALVGHAILAASAAPSVIEKPNTSLGVFCLAVIVMGVGTGGFKSNCSPLIAEQYREKVHVKTLKTGERVIVDPVATYSRIYMWFYLMINVGALIGQLGMVYVEKYVGFWLAFALPTFVFIACPAVLIFARKHLVVQKPTGSVVPVAWRAIKAASKGRWHLNPVRTYKDHQRGDFWAAAKPSTYEREGKVMPSWLTWDDVFVDELKRGIAACKVFMYYPLWWLTYNQIIGNLTSQAATMTLNGVPNDVLQNLDPFALIIFIPICDQFLYPWLARIGFPLSPIKKIYLGFFTGTAAMIWAAVVQHYIYKTSNCGNYAGNPYLDAAKTIRCVSPLSVWIQTGSYVLIAFSEIFASITGLEYAFSKAPRSMRSIVTSLFLFTSAISTALGQAFVSLSSDPNLVINYAVMGALSFVGGVAFYFHFRQLDRDEDMLNQIGVHKQAHLNSVDNQSNDMYPNIEGRLPAGSLPEKK